MFKNRQTSEVVLRLLEVKNGVKNGSKNGQKWGFLAKFKKVEVHPNGQLSKMRKNVFQRGRKKLKKVKSW
jgi:hypothetical protein